MDEFEKSVEEAKARHEQIKNLAVSITKEMTELSFSFEEYQTLKSVLDFLVKTSKISL